MEPAQANGASAGQPCEVERFEPRGVPTFRGVALMADQLRDNFFRECCEEIKSTRLSGVSAQVVACGDSALSSLWYVRRNAQVVVDCRDTDDVATAQHHFPPRGLVVYLAGHRHRDGVRVEAHR